MAKFSQLAMDFLKLHPNAALPPKRFCMGLEAVPDLVVPKGKNKNLMATEITGHLRYFIGSFRQVGFLPGKWQFANNNVYLIDISKTISSQSHFHF